MSGTRAGPYRAGEPHDARPIVGARRSLAPRVTRGGDPNGWAESAVRPIGTSTPVAHDQPVLFAGRQSAEPLVHCSACGRASGPYWWRWRAYRIEDPEFGDLPRVAVYCQSCADRTFGAPRRRPLVERRQAPRPQHPE